MTRGQKVGLAVVALLLVAGAGVYVARRVDLVRRLEGLRLEVYRDVGGKWTVGYGHLIRPGEPYHPYGPIRRITRAQAEQLLARDLAEAEGALRALVRVPLAPHQFAALASFVFNVGRDAFARSTLLRRLNAGDRAGAAAELDKWVHAGGRRQPSLVARRAAERALFLAA